MSDAATRVARIPTALPSRVFEVHRVEVPSGAYVWIGEFEAGRRGEFHPTVRAIQIDPEQIPALVDALRDAARVGARE